MSTAALVGLEEALGGRLPAALREYLLGGAPPLWGTVAAPGSWPHGAEVDVQRVFALAAGALERATLTAYAGRIPDVVLPFARTTCGNLVVVGYDGFDAGRVWLCDRSRVASGPALAGMRAELLAHGVDEELDDDGVVWFWERLLPGRRSWRIGFADVYLLADDVGLWLAGFAPGGLIATTDAARRRT